MEWTTLEGERLRDDDNDDTVIRRPRGALSSDRVGDALDDTVIRPPGDPADAGSPLDDTVIRAPGSRPTLEPIPAAPGAAVAGVDAPDLDAPDLDDTVVRAPGRPPGAPSRSGPGDPGLPATASTEPARRVPSVRIADRTFRLDRPVVVGRRPSLPRVAHGTEPELVTVRSSNGQVSSTHVRLHAEGEAVVVQDLRSTNGTVIRPAGAPAYRMPSGASIVALTGTVVEIGDGNAIEVLSPYLRVAPTTDGLPPVPPWPTDQTAHGTPRTPRERS
ncbi:FHA domain-containing protein [Curtobacterium sp. PhB115]|uniref:FHA domain-containing protein n=1 Tax=Curtobacterium sp. PhB115 TaxID=2485173 RepID=UPI000FB8942E|nr:FHA domain-containing protein [Curtobacterium sp. PhB115]ROP60677.1 FHA domain-containing protein [Curtobacterium sp. PhB115]